MSWIAAGASVLSAGIGYLGQKDANRTAEKLAKEGRGGEGQFFGPGVEYADDILGRAATLGRRGLLSPNADPLAQLGRANQLGYAQNLLPNLVANAQTGWRQALSGGINPYTTQMIQAAQNDMLQDFGRHTLPALADKAQSVGGFGGGRQGIAQGLAAEGLTEAMGDVSAKMLNRAWDTAQQQQARAWATAPTMFGAGRLPGQIQEEMGIRQGSAPIENLQTWNQLVAPWRSVETSGGAPANATSPWQTAAGMASIGYGLGNQISDWWGNRGGTTYNVAPVGMDPSTSQAMNNLFNPVLGLGTPSTTAPAATPGPFGY